MKLIRKPKIFSAVLAVALAFVPVVGSSQALPALAPSSAKASPTAAQADPLKRTTPRSAMYAFLEAIHNSNYELAAQYLDLSRIRPSQRLVQGSQLAQQLGQVLDRDTQFVVGHLSNEPGGNSGDSLTPNLDKLNDYEVDGQTVALYLQRETSSNGEIWLVSADSLTHLSQIAASFSESPLEKRLPAALVHNHVLGTPLWIWLALLISGLLVIGISQLLARAFLALARPITRRYSQKVHAHRLESFIRPLRLVFEVILYRACIEFIGPSALLRDTLLKFLALLSIWGIAWFLMIIVDVISDTIISRLDVRERAVSYSVIPLFVRSVKVIIGFIAILSVIGAWGYNINAVLAGLGVGGIAVALAAQKTIENLFGGISVISDKPVLVGDFCQFGGQVGTVEDIGLRSTRIRTLDRTVVTVPNSSFSTMTLENYAKRDRMWFHPTLNLRRDTRPEKIRAMMDAVTQILHDHPKVDPTSVPLRFTKIGKESFDVDIFAYVLTADSNEFLCVQSELLLSILEASVHLGVEFAVPIQEAVAPSFSDLGAPTLSPSSPQASNTAPNAGP